MQQNSGNPYALNRYELNQFITQPFTGQNPTRGNPNVNLGALSVPSTQTPVPSPDVNSGRLQITPPDPLSQYIGEGYNQTPVSKPGDVDANGNLIPAGTFDPVLKAQNDRINAQKKAVTDGYEQLVGSGLDDQTARQTLAKITNNFQSDFDPAAFKDQLSTVATSAKNTQAEKMLNEKDMNTAGLAYMKAQNARGIADSNHETQLQIAELKGKGDKPSLDQAKTLEQYTVAKSSLDSMLGSLTPALGGTGDFDPTSASAAALGTKDNLLHNFGAMGDYVANKTDNPNMKNYEAASGGILATLYHQMYGARITAQEMMSPKMNGVRISLANAYLPNYGESPQTANQKLQRLQLAVEAMKKRAGITDADKYAVAPPSTGWSTILLYLIVKRL